MTHAIDIALIPTLGLDVANAGAIRSLDHVGNEMFDHSIGIVALIYETDPPRMAE